MSQKIRKFYPEYRLGRGDELVSNRTATFYFGGVFYTTSLPLFGATETQKAVIRWATATLTPPVMSVSHDAPRSSDVDKIHPNPQWLHLRYFPYAMTDAEVHCLGESAPRKVRVYFCRSEAWNPETQQMFRSKTTYVVPL